MSKHIYQSSVFFCLFVLGGFFVYFCFEKGKKGVGEGKRKDKGVQPLCLDLAERGRDQ